MLACLHPFGEIPLTTRPLGHGALVPVQGCLPMANPSFLPCQSYIGSSSINVFLPYCWPQPLPCRGCFLLRNTRIAIAVSCRQSHDTKASTIRKPSIIPSFACLSLSLIQGAFSHYLLYTRIPCSSLAAMARARYVSIILYEYFIFHTQTLYLKRIFP